MAVSHEFEVHCSNRLMDSTLFSTNCFSFIFSLEHHDIAIVESVAYTISLGSIGDAFLTIYESFNVSIDLPEERLGQDLVFVLEFEYGRPQYCKSSMKSFLSWYGYDFMRDHVQKYLSSYKIFLRYRNPFNSCFLYVIKFILLK